MIYLDHAELYDEMYKIIFDYDEQFGLVDEYMKEREFDKILEIACGTGRLIKKLSQNGYDVKGLDISEEMLKIAKERVPEIEFIQGDMRDFDLKEKFDAVVCFGHSFAYMVKDEDIYNSLECFNDHLRQGGLLMMDNFNGLQTIEGFERYHEMKDTVELDDRLIERDNIVEWNIGPGISWDWRCEYTVIKDGVVIDDFMDKQVMRSFLKSELSYFLEKRGFEVLDFYEEKFIHVAKKIEEL